VVVLIKFHRLVLRISILRHIELLNFVVLVDRHTLVHGLGFVEFRVGGRTGNISALILPLVPMLAGLLIMLDGRRMLDVLVVRREALTGLFVILLAGRSGTCRMSRSWRCMLHRLRLLFLLRFTLLGLRVRATRQRETAY